MVKKGFLVLVMIVLGIFLVSFASAWILNGTVHDVNGNVLQNANVSINGMFSPGGHNQLFFRD